MVGTLSRIGLVILFTLAAPLAFSQEVIAIVNQERVLFGSNVAQQASTELREQFSGQEQQIQQLEQEITDLRERAETDSALMSEEEANSLQSRIQQQLQNRQQLVSQLQNAQQQRRQEFVQQYESTVTGILESMVEARDIDLLLSSSEVLYANPDLDLTEEALQRFNHATADE